MRYCPAFITPHYTLQPLRHSDAPGLLAVYGCAQAQAYIYEKSSGFDHAIRQMEAMNRCVDAWCEEISAGKRLTWCIRRGAQAVGTADFLFLPDDSALLTVDLRPEHEFDDVFEELLRTMFPGAFDVLGVQRVYMRSAFFMQQRQRAMGWHGFRPMRRKIAGPDGALHGDYWFLPRPRTKQNSSAPITSPSSA